MPESHKKRTTLYVVLEDWTQRVGPDAAKYRIFYYQWSFRAWFAAIIGFVLIVVGGFAHLSAVLLVGLLGIVTWVALYLVSIRMLVLMNKEIARSLDIPPFPFFSGPPSRQREYRKWCEKRGLDPYPFQGVRTPHIPTRWI
jgi:hypothetical protein